MSDPARGDDPITCFLGGCVGLVVFGGLLVWVLSFLFD